MQALLPNMPRRRHCSCRYQAGTVDERGEKAAAVGLERSSGSVAAVAVVESCKRKTVIRATAPMRRTLASILFLPVMA